MKTSGVPSTMLLTLIRLVGSLGDHAVRQSSPLYPRLNLPNLPSLRSTISSLRIASASASLDPSRPDPPRSDPVPAPPTPNSTPGTTCSQLGWVVPLASSSSAAKRAVNVAVCVHVGCGERPGHRVRSSVKFGQRGR